MAKEMNRKHFKPLLWLIAALAIVGAGVFMLPHTSVVESVKRESARLFEYEYIPNQNVDIDSCEAAKSADSIYRDFRKKYRFHYQTIGMASFADSSRLILLSDIPPHFDTDSIPPIFSKFTHKAEMRQHHIGYDGYVTDVVLLLGNATKENCDKLIQRLNRELFFSDYKPTVMTLPAEQGRRYYIKTDTDGTGNAGIDYQITLNEFNDWFVNGKEDVEGFIHLEDTNTILTVSDMFVAKTRGVYFSHKPGFVAWALPKNSDIADDSLMQSIRQFTLDADLILGALADSCTLVIIGRERQSALYELPPLQVETILLLASINEKELSQSLDINDLMAGKMNNGRDWCPTYLSKELENTEFGDLMTITDVLLKDWSERGTIQEGYYRYPEPGYYPFDKPLFRKLGLNELVYNWNTAGAMYAIDCKGTENPANTGDYTIYTLGRTGSLPVSYFNSQERSQSIGYRYENQAYHYFATLGNTDLARVVQYTALYQLFIDNKISYSGNTYYSFPKNKPFLLYKPTSQLLSIIKDMGNNEIDMLADSISLRSFNAFQKEKVDKQLRENEQTHNFSYSDENIDRIYKDVHRNTKDGIRHSIAEVKNMLGNLTDDQFKKLARYLSYPRGVVIRDRESYNTYLQGRKVNQLMREIGKNNLDLLGMDLGNVKNWYSANLKGNAGRYMKTSSLIITYNDMLTTGGHNISSHISRVNSMTNYKRNRNYTPTDYQKPGNNEPTPHSNLVPSNDNTPQKTSNKSHKNISTKTSKTSTHKATKPSNPQRTKPSIRPRGEVISTTPRRTRGL